MARRTVRVGFRPFPVRYYLETLDRNRELIVPANVAKTLSVLLLVTVGCSLSDKSIQVVETLRNLETTESSQTVETAAESNHVESVELPYEDRISPFSESVESAEPAPDPSTRAVLRGYIDVGGIAAVIAYRGETHVLREGQTKGRVTVTKIEPPIVDLRIGGMPHEVSLHHVNTGKIKPK